MQLLALYLSVLSLLSVLFNTITITTTSVIYATGTTNATSVSSATRDTSATSTIQLLAVLHNYYSMSELSWHDRKRGN